MKKTLRTAESEKLYQQREKKDTCIFCTRIPLVRYKYWVILMNKYPYDRIARKHYMLAPKRHVPGFEHLWGYEWEELREIMEEINRSDLDHIQYNLPKTQSVPEHLHVHLIEYNQ